MRQWPRAAAVGAILVCLASCGPLGRPRACSVDADCSSGSFCAQGSCTDMRADDCRRVACTVSIVAPGSTAYTEGAVAFQVSISGTVPDTVELLRDGGPLATLTPPYQYTWDTSAEAEGTHEIVARATQGPTVFASEPRAVVVSRTPHTIAISTPSSTMFANGPVAFQLTLTGLPPDRVTLLKDGAVLTTLAPPYEYTWDTAAVPEGTYQFVARATQGSAAFTSEPRTIVVSRAARAVAIAAPSATTFTNGQIAFKLMFSGPPPESVELLKDGSLLAALAPPYEYTWNTAAEPEGSYRFVARARQAGTTYSSEPRSVVVDRTPPVVVAQSPAPGDTNVALRAPIYVQFSEPVKLSADAAGGVVSLTGAGGAVLSANITLSSDQQRLLVSYVLDPAVPSDVALSLRSGITDLAGNPLTLPAPWGWHMPLWQRLGPYVRQAGWISGIDLAVDATGRPTVAWLEQDGISVARWTGELWEKLGTAIHGPGAVNSTPVVALKPSGDPVLAWTEDTDSDPNRIVSRIFVKQKTVNGWDYVGQNPVGQDGSETLSPSLAVDSSGVIWLGSREHMAGSAQHAVVRRFDGYLYWVQEGANLNRAERNAEAPKLAFDGNGTLWAAWTESAGFGGIDNYLVYDVFTSQLLPGGWTSIGGVLNANASAPAYNVKLVPVPGGFPVVTWSERVGSFSYNSWYRVLGFGVWGQQQPAAYSSVATPPMSATNGYLYSPGRVSPYVMSASPINQAAWNSVGTEDIKMSPSSAVSYTTIQATASGDVLVFWVEGEGSLSSLYVKRLNR
jgi:Bacterial Ig-like domain/Bacterial Ig domain